MPRIDRHSSRPAAAALASILVLASVALAACGGSSSSNTTNASAAASTTTTPATGTTVPGAAPAGAGGSRFAAVRECLQKQGITLPKRTPGQGRPSGGFLGGGGGGAHLPSGVSRSQFEAAMKKCGGGFSRSFNPARSAQTKAALAKFSTCMNENGVKLPAPNSSGKGPIFDTTGIDTNSSQFKAAEAKCRSILASAFRVSPGGAAPGAAG